MYGKGTAREFIRFPIAAAVGHLVRVWDRLPDLVPERHRKVSERALCIRRSSNRSQRLSRYPAGHGSGLLEGLVVHSQLPTQKKPADHEHAAIAGISVRSSSLSSERRSS